MYCMILYVECERVDLIEVESRIVVNRDQGQIEGRRDGER
jgi:hypothetical protein